jgi:hypothetical protein
MLFVGFIDAGGAADAKEEAYCSCQPTHKSLVPKSTIPTLVTHLFSSLSKVDISSFSSYLISLSRFPATLFY